MKRLAYLLVCAAMLAVSLPTLASGGQTMRGAGTTNKSFFDDCEALVAVPLIYRLCLAAKKAATPRGTVVATGTIDASSPTGSTAQLPFPAQYRIVISGTWTNTGDNWLDAEYASTPTGHQDGWDGLGADFGDTQVDGAFVDWGTFDAGHSYSRTGSFARSVNLSVFVGMGGTKMPAWYADNSGSLAYSITYVG
ncbi:MAG TPA: hypothetical protein VNP93_05435 [Gaiellaceae bacterium]|nr:hypothetical protein [Gaiellaceae bacterium]